MNIRYIYHKVHTYTSEKGSKYQLSIDTLVHLSRLLSPASTHDQLLCTHDQPLCTFSTLHLGILVGILSVSSTYDDGPTAPFHDRTRVARETTCLFLPPYRNATMRKKKEKSNHGNCAARFTRNLSSSDGFQRMLYLMFFEITHSFVTSHGSELGK